MKKVILCYVKKLFCNALRKYVMYQVGNIIPKLREKCYPASSEKCFPVGATKNYILYYAMLFRSTVRDKC